MDIIPIILSGGVGSRLWPLSRKAHPKPFIKLADNQSLIQRTYARILSITGIKEIVTVTNRELYFYTKDEYRELQQTIHNAFILEPFGRNSAAAIALASHYVNQKYGKQAMLLIFPADHLIAEASMLQAAITEAIKLAAEGKLVTFGIKPEGPKTGYGYLQAEGNKIIKFIEKPSQEAANTYIAEGNYLWNSGMFCMRVDTILNEMELHCVSISNQAKHAINNAISSESKSHTQKEIKEEDFNKIEEISIDYAVFEKSNNVGVVCCDLGWSDIGSFLEFSQVLPEDDHNNRVLGDTVFEDVTDCFIYSEKRLVAGLGLKDLMIVDTSDAILIADKNRVQDVKKIVSKLKDRDHQSHNFFETVHRPWGQYTILQEGPGYKLKQIMVKPGASLSLQSHKYRSEHWVVVEGIARIINGDQLFILQNNQSAYIPVGNKHRLENSGPKTLILIEVQCGDYLNEDDIIRYDDIYNRIDYKVEDVL